jgi:hypothetical protein
MERLRRARPAGAVGGAQVWGWSGPQGFLEMAQPVAVALDVEDMGAVEQAIEDGGCQHLVAGKQFCPVADPLVGGNPHGAAALAVTGEPEE